MLIGLSKRQSNCRVCSTFNEETLNEISIDLLLNRRTYDEILDHYNRLIPSGIKHLQAFNLTSHKRHCNPALLAKAAMQQKEQPTTKAEVAARIYAELYNESIDKFKILDELYRERIKNLQTLQYLLNVKTNRYEAIQFTQDPILGKEAIKLEGNIIELTSKIDNIQDSIQTAVIKENASNKGVTQNNTYITNNVINVMQDKLKVFMEEIVPYLLVDVFAEDQDKGRTVVKQIANSMDKHLAEFNTQVTI